MPSPISNQSSLNLNALHQNGVQSVQNGTPHANSGAAISARPKPGNGMARVNGQMLPMTSVNESGFTSAFPTRNSAAIAQRSRLGINPQRAQQLLSQHEHLATEARLAMEHIINSELNNFPQAKNNLDQLSHQRYHRVPLQGGFRG